MGKTNLSEWANYFCSGCPNGYTALGGQTLNPYGRKKIDTGGLFNFQEVGQPQHQI